MHGNNRATNAARWAVTGIALVLSIACGRSGRSADRPPVSDLDTRFVAISRDALGQRAAIHLFAFHGAVSEGAWLTWIVGAQTTDIWLDSNDRWDSSLSGAGIGVAPRLTWNQDGVLAPERWSISLLADGPTRSLLEFPLDGSTPSEFRSSPTPDLAESGLTIRDVAALPGPRIAISREASSLDSSRGDDIALIDPPSALGREAILARQIALSATGERIGPERMGFAADRLFVGLTRSGSSGGLSLGAESGAIAVVDPVGMRVASVFGLSGLANCGELVVAESENDGVDLTTHLIVACAGDPSNEAAQRASAGLVAIDAITHIVGRSSDEPLPDPALIVDRVWRADTASQLLPSRGLVALPGRLALIVSDGLIGGEDVLFTVDMQTATVQHPRVLAQPRSPDSDAFRIGNPAFDRAEGVIAVPMGQPGLRLLELQTEGDELYVCPSDPRCRKSEEVFQTPLPTANGRWVWEVQATSATPPVVAPLQSR